MTYKLIVYSTHARNYITERQITREDVRFVLSKGIRRIETSQKYPGAQVYSKRGEIGRKVDGRSEMRVVYVENETRILVITIMWIWGGKKGDR